MIKKVIFFIAYPLNLRDYTRFGAEVISKNGFEVFFFDFSDYMFPSLKEKITIAPVDCKGHYPFASEEEAICAILNLSKDCFVVCNVSCSYKSFKIYRALSKKKIPYVISVTNAIPVLVHNAEDNVSQKSKVSNVVNFFRRLSCLTLPKLRRFIINYLFQPRFYKYWRISAARLCLAGGVDSVNPYQIKRHYPFAKDTEILWTHTLDYDIYLENPIGRVLNTQNKAVFLDPAGPQFVGGDDIMTGSAPALTKEKYYPSLCKFFDRVETEQGVKVVIAGHPRAKHDTYPEYFGKRLTLNDKTFQMIKDSKFVITHGSTAVSFAVLLNKPVIFITTDEYEASPYGDSYGIKSMASGLGKNLINIDHQFCLDWDKELSINKNYYADYKHAYIKKTGTEDLNSWQIFCNKLKSL